jgi:hypothetical protein
MQIGLSLSLTNVLLSSAADFYGVGGFSPSLVFDFSSEFYRTGGSMITFDAAMTHTRSGNATMVDSDGVLKWAPHNLLLWSDDPSTTFSTNNDSVWTGANTLFATAQAGTQAPYGREGFTFPSAGTYSFEFEVTDANVQYVTITFQSFDGGANGLDVFDVQSGSVATESANHTASISATTDGYLCKVVATLDGSDLSGSFDLGISEEAAVTRITDPDGTEYAVFRRLRTYRSDLGGMVDNPDTGNSYVPTTSAARYLPRRGHHIYNGAEWVNEGVLVESETRTNLLPRSNDLTSVDWTRSGVTVLNGQELGPDETASLAKITLSTASESHQIFDSISVSSGATHTTSAYLKAGTQRYIGLRNYRAANNWSTAVFDLQTGIVTQESVGSGSGTIAASGVESLGGGLYRCYLASSEVGSTVFPVIQAHSSGTPTLQASAGNEVFLGASETFYAGFAQLEAGSTPSSYIPTSGSTATRSADAITVPSANLPYSATAMSIQMDGTVTGNTYTPTRWYLDANNAILQDIGSTDFTFTQEAAGVVDTVTGGSFTSGVNTPYNIASRHGSTFINGAVDGTALTADTTPTALPDLSATDLSLAFDYMGTVKTLRIWSDDLGDSGIAEAST